MRLTPLGRAYARFARDFVLGCVALLPLLALLAFNPWKA